jgi:CheY-like chemotaxis protein/HAMP domain-containing protein
MPESRGVGGWFSGLPLERKSLFAFLGVLLLQLVSAATFIIVQQQETRAQNLAARSQKALGHINQAITAFRVEQVDMLVQVLQPSTLQLQQQAGDAAEFERELAAIAQYTDDDPAQQVRVARLNALLNRWELEVVRPVRSFDLQKQLGGGNRSELDALLAAGRSLDQQFQELLSVMRDQESRQLAARMHHLQESARLGMTSTVATLFVTALFGLFILRFASQTLARPLREITDLMTRLAAQDHSIEIPGLKRRDEIGEMARALQVFKKLSIETSETTWTKSGIAAVSSSLQAVRDRGDFAETLTSDLASLLRIGVGVFYVFDEESQQLELMGSYGFRQRRHVTPRYRLGEGLVGECARERKPIILESVPEDYIRIQSGLGEAPPHTIQLLPIIAHGQLLGVLELGTFGQFTARDLRFLDELVPLVALSLENLLRTIRTETLLQQTQAQAEALRMSEQTLQRQQQELHSTNEELRVKAEELQRQSARLKASEEELRAQTEELQATNEELREKSEVLDEQNRALEVLRQETERKAQELARASQYKSDFLANMSHELRTPLNSLLILSRGLADNEDGNLSEDQVESARVIHDSGSNLLRLINDILDLSKVESGRMDVVVEDLNLRAFVASLVRNFRHVAKERKLEFGVEIEPGMPDSVRTDPAKLEQVTNNLLANAFKFTREGGVRVRIGRPSPDIAALLSGGTPEHTVAIAVTDTGIGVPEEKFDKVFQAFEQVDASTSRQYGGTGLGLTISRSLAQLLGGEIHLDSSVNGGSTFTIVLPEQYAGANAQTAAAAVPSPAPMQTRPAVSGAALPAPSIPDDRDRLEPGATVILIIEDDPSFARILAEMVRRKGFNALAAADGEAGLTLARRFRPTGILLDVMLPGVDGWTVMDRLKGDIATRHIPVHFISAVDEHSRGLEMGAVGFLTKPVSRDEISSAFERLLHFSEGKPRSVLIVDDDEASRLAVRKLIAAQATEITEAASGEEALQKLVGGQFDCIVLDLGLPGMDGFEFLDRAAHSDRVPPVVIYSGRELSKEENLRLRQYTDSIVIKGVRSPERLLDEVSLFLHSIRSGPAVPPRQVDASLSGRTVLVVDDDMRNVFALSKALRSKGLNVVMAQDGHKALKQLADNQDIEMVLMDIMMPGMDGYETIREIRKQPSLTKMPIIALTAKAMRGDREKCLEAGANDYVSKPIDIEKLLSMMRVWLSR